MAKSFDRTQMRHKRIRKKVTGTPERPRLSVHFSGQHVYAQVIDDQAGITLASAQTTESVFEARSVRANAVTAEKVGQLLAERAKKKKIEKVVFDRGGFLYHGKVKALADAAREGGLQF
jgi:large subunit ribosomal protein L18